MSGYQSFSAAEARKTAALSRVRRPITASGWLTSGALRAGLEQRVYQYTLTYQPPRHILPNLRVVLRSDSDGYVVILADMHGWTSVYTERLNRARQLFHAYAHAFTTGDLADRVAADTLFQQDQSIGASA